MIVIQYVVFIMIFPFYLGGITLVLWGLFFPEQYLDTRWKWEQKFWKTSQRIRRYLILSISFFFAARYAQLEILWLLWAIFLLAAAAINLLKLKRPQIFNVSIIKKKQRPAIVRMILVSWLVSRVFLFTLWSYAWRHLFF